MDAERLATRRGYEGRVIAVDEDRVRLPNGRVATLEMVRHPGASAVLPVDGEGRLLLVRQYRWAAGGYLLEVPAGKLDPGETPKACAARELEEETGYRAGWLEPLGSIWTTPGFTDEVIHLFLAGDLGEGRQRLDRDEVLEPMPVPASEAWAMVERGEIRDAKTLCVLALARERLLDTER